MAVTRNRPVDFVTESFTTSYGRLSEKKLMITCYYIKRTFLEGVCAKEKERVTWCSCVSSRNTFFFCAEMNV